MGQNKEKAAELLYHLGNRTICIVGSMIFLVLTLFSLIFTQYMPPGGAEIPLNMPDSPILNLMGLAVAAGVMAGLVVGERRMERRTQFIISRISAAVMIVWILSASLWWVNSSAHVPVGDQAFIYGGASYFMEGNYAFLDAGGYCDMYPYQLGLIALCELLFRLVGAYRYYAFEIICVLMAAGSACCGHGILSEILGNSVVLVGFHLLMMGCLPLIFYTPWVYGDIPGLFFCMLAAWMLLRYFRRQKVRYLAVMAVSLIFAMLVRKSSVILLITVGMVSLLHALCRRDKKILAAFLTAAVLAYGAYGVIYRVYEVRSGYQHSEGIPFATWLAMGMQETKGTYGWDNDDYKSVYYESGFDSRATAQVAWQDVRERLDVFMTNPVYGIQFFGKKLLSQWNGPLYQALFFNAESPEAEGGPAPGTLAARLGGEYYRYVLALCDRWQFVVYGGMLCYFLLAVKKDSNMLQHVLAIVVIGGFFYSMLAEGKARYIFPYYVMMFPCAVYGYYQAVLFFGKRAEQRRR